MNFDDLTDDRDEDTTGSVSTPQGSAPQGAPQPSFDELQDDRHQQPQASMEGSEQAAPSSFDDLQDDRATAPSGEWSQAGSAAAGAAKGAVPTTGGLAAGLYAGAATTAASAPLLGPAAPVAGVLAGLGVGMGASWLLDMGQDKLLAMVGWDKPLNEAREANPNTFDVAGMATSAALLKPTGSMIQRGVGAAIGAGAEAGMQTIHGEGYDLKKIGAAAGLGFALPTANKVGSTVLAAGERVGGNLYRGEGGRYRGGNKNPDVKELPPEAAAPQEPDITVANDEPNVAAGVAVEQGPAPEIIGAGNPEGAPGAQRTAARPSDPERNYQKDQAQNQPATTESKVIDTEPMKSDIKAALEPEEAHTQSEPEAQVPRPDGTDVLPQEAAPTNRMPPGPGEPALDAAREHREALGRVQEKMAGQQQGEDFHGLDTEQAPKAAEALTPAEAKSLAEDRKMLAKAGFDRALAHLDAVSPREQVGKIRELANAARQQLATADENVKPSEAEARRPTGEVRKESRAKVSTGVLAASKADAARKEAAITHVNSIYGEFGPQSERGKAVDPLNGDTKATKAFTKEVWAEAVKRNGGKDPLVRSPDQYVPLQKGDHSDAYQWLKAVKASAKGQNHRNFATLHTTEGMGKLDAETGRVEGDIAHRPQVEEAGAEAETATGAMEHSRTSFEHLEPDPRPGADNSYVEDHNTLADWINERSPREYEKLSEKYDLRAEMDEPADPRELMSDMKQTLADTGRRPKGELTSEVELPAKRVKAPTLPQKEEAAPAGRVLDKNSDEFRQLAAQYEKNAPQGPAKSKAEQVSDLNAKERSASEAINGSTHEAVIDKIKSFIGDESGAGFIHAKLQQMFSQPASPQSPVAAPGVVDYAKSLPGKFWDLEAKVKNKRVELMAHWAAAADAGLTEREHRQISLADQDNRIGSLPQKLQDHYRDFTVPLRNEAMQVMRDFKDLNDTEKLGYDLPNLNAVTTKAYQPRYDISKQSFNKMDTDVFDPYSGKGLGDFSPNLEDRKFFSIENGTDRMVIEVTGDKDSGFGANIHRGPSNVTTLKGIPASFEGKLGDVLDLNVKGKRGKWTVDQATTKEIEGATGIKYYENATWAWGRMLDDMNRAYENAKLTTNIKNDPEFQKLTTTDRKVAEANGWPTKITTHLPDFATRNGKPLLMPENMQWAFDDYHKPGFGGTTGRGIEFARRANIALLKVFNTNAPLVHVLNELDLGIVSRGLKWLSPTGYYNLAMAAPKAWKSVNSQDALQREMRTAGINPMLASVGMRTMNETAAKNFGLEIIKNHSQWDPFARAFGVSTKELGHKLYDLSSDVTWRLSDMLTTMRYLEERAGGDFGAKPKSPEEAARTVNKFMSDYHIGTTLMGSRTLQQLVTEPAVTAFGRYKAGVFRSFHHIGKDLLGKEATPRERLDAAAQLLIMGALGYMVYPAADALVRKVTGNEGGELRRRGITSVADAVKNVATGEKDPSAMLTRAWTPAPLLNTAIEAKSNKDFAGKPIIPQGEWPGIAPEAAANVAEYAAKTAIPPYGTISQHYARPEGTPGGAIGAFAADQLGVGLPSDASQKRAGRIEKVNAQAAKARQKRPSGVIPDLMNRFTD